MASPSWQHSRPALEDPIPKAAALARPAAAAVGPPIALSSPPGPRGAGLASPPVPAAGLTAPVSAPGSRLLPHLQRQQREQEQWQQREQEREAAAKEEGGKAAKSALIWRYVQEQLAKSAGHEDWHFQHPTEECRGGSCERRAERHAVRQYRRRGRLRRRVARR